MEAPGGEEARGTDWSALPFDMLELITRKLGEIEDFVRFGIVCKSWRSAAIPSNLQTQVPWVVVPCDPESSSRRFYSVSAKKVYTLHLPESRDHAIAGTPHGWLVMADVFLSLSLFNPLSRAQIRLPPVTTFPHSSEMQFYRTADGIVQHWRSNGRIDLIPLVSMLHKFNAHVFLSGSDSIVVLTFEGLPQFSYCRMGDTAWTTIDSGSDCVLATITYLDGRLYVMDLKERVRVCDLSRGADAVFVLIPSLVLVRPLEFPDLLFTCNFVALAGELLLITTCPIFGMNMVHVGFYKSDTRAAEPIWSEAQSVDDCTLLVFLSRISPGRNIIAFLADDDSQYRKNWVYWLGSGEIQIYNVSKYVSEYRGREIFAFYRGVAAEFLPHLASMLHGSTWMAPSLC